MSDLFSTEWMEGFMQAWNEDPSLVDALSDIGFTSTIGYGFPSEIEPRGVLVVENGQCVSAGSYAGQPLNWDIRAREDQWTTWQEKPPGMAALGMAFTTGKMKFEVGDYGAMIKDPRMASPFIKSFSVMARVH